MLVLISADVHGQNRAVPVDGGPVKVATIERTVEAVGTLTSNESVVLKPEVAGIVSMITSEEGHFVRKGTLVAQLEDRILQAEHEQVLARFELSRQNLQRAEDLSNKGAGTDRALDEARASHRLNAAALNLAKARLDQTKIVAPFDGVLGLKAVSVGDYLKSGDAVINLESIDPIKVDFRVPEIYLADLKPGQDIAVKVDALPSRAFAGEITAIDPLIDVNGRSIAIRAVIPNTDRALRPGLFARVDVVLERRENAVLVPEQTVVLSGGKKFVFKVTDGKAARVEVTTGLRKGADVEITSGLAAGDVVVTSGQGKLRDGDTIDLPADARS
jgi:membrane fusion protein (multidrug efflux system)